MSTKVVVMQRLASMSAASANAGQSLHYNYYRVVTSIIEACNRHSNIHGV